MTDTTVTCSYHEAGQLSSVLTDNYVGEVSSMCCNGSDDKLAIQPHRTCGTYVFNNHFHSFKENSGFYG